MKNLVGRWWMSRSHCGGSRLVSQTSKNLGMDRPPLAVYQRSVPRHRSMQRMAHTLPETFSACAAFSTRRFKGCRHANVDGLAWVAFCRRLGWVLKGVAENLHIAFKYPLVRILGAHRFEFILMA